MKTTFVTLLRREFWENRGAFLTTPVAIGAIVLFLTLLALSVIHITVVKIDGQEFVLSHLVQGLQALTPSQLNAALDVQLLGLAGVFNLVLFIVVFFYLLGALYDDRKDRSILFWKSLPVSDLQTVMSKLVAAILLAPLLMMAAVAATELALMLIGTLLLWGADMSPWTYLWGPADPVEIWMLLLAAYAVQALWILPIWGWLLLVSAFARSKPFLWAILPPVFLGIMQSWFNLTQYFRWDDNWVWSTLGERLLGGVVPMSFAMSDGAGSQLHVGVVQFSEGEPEGPATLTYSALLDRLAGADLWWGVVVGVLFLTAAIFIRRYRDES